MWLSKKRNLELKHPKAYSTQTLSLIAGRATFKGQALHSGQYQVPEDFIDKRIAIVGEGNSGAQILAEGSKVTNAIWITRKEPRFLPDHTDGRYLFDAATQMYEAQKKGKQFKPHSFGDIVVVDSAKERAQGKY